MVKSCFQPVSHTSSCLRALSALWVRRISTLVDTSVSCWLLQPVCYLPTHPHPPPHPYTHMLLMVLFNILVDHAQMILLRRVVMKKGGLPPRVMEGLPAAAGAHVGLSAHEPHQLLLEGPLCLGDTTNQPSLVVHRFPAGSYHPFVAPPPPPIHSTTPSTRCFSTSRSILNEGGWS